MKYTSSFLWIVATLLLALSTTHGSQSRQKRMLWFTREGRMALPPGTQLTVHLSLSGFLSPMTVNYPITIDFDSLGLTDSQNPFGSFPSLTKNIGRSMRSVFGDLIAHFVEGRRSTRSVQSDSMDSNVPRNERIYMYKMVEYMLTMFEMNGKACLLRAICEVHSHNSIHKLGFIGEFLHLFLTVSTLKSEALMQDYVAAETAGKNQTKCEPFFQECPKLLFLSDEFL